MTQTTDATDREASTKKVPSDRDWRKRLILALTILAFLAIGSVVLYVLSLIVGAVILLILSALLAYLIYPLVLFLQRLLARSLAIALAYLLIASAMVAGMFVLTTSLIEQSSALAQSIHYLLSPAGERQFQSLVDFAGKLGLSQDQLVQLRNQLLAQVQSALLGLVPLLITFLSNIINLIIVITLSVYFVVDGPRIISWLSLKTPASQRGTINFLLHAFDQSLGGYFRGSLLIALIGALMTWAGLGLLHVPYATLLGLLFFFLYFLPVIGAYVLGVLCVLAALPQGWVVMSMVAVFLTLLQGIVIGQILSPRVFRTTVGVHPIVALFALFAGAELFGVLGGFLSVPVAGALQQMIVVLWHRWKDEHPQQFPPEELLPQP